MALCQLVILGLEVKIQFTKGFPFLSGSIGILSSLRSSARAGIGLEGKQGGI